MSRSYQRVAMACALALAAPLSFAADGWSQLRIGMTRTETSAVLGAPLLKNRGRGFELWLYDGGAEVVCFRNAVIGWTAPPWALRTPISAPAVPSEPTPLIDASSPRRARGASRDQLHRVYDRFPAFRTEIRL